MLLPLTAAHDARGEYLSGAAGEPQHAVDVLLGLVMAAHEPEEEAGMVQGSPTGRLTHFLQAALELLNRLPVCELGGGRGQVRVRRCAWSCRGTEGPSSCHWTLWGPLNTWAPLHTSLGLERSNTGPCGATGAAQAWTWACCLRFTFSLWCPAVC